MIPSNLRDKLWIGLGLCFWTGLFFQNQQNMLTQEHKILAKSRSSYYLKKKNVFSKLRLV